MLWPQILPTLGVRARTYTSHIHAYLCLVSLWATSNARLWEGLSVCVVSDSTMGSVVCLNVNDRLTKLKCSVYCTIVKACLWSCPIIPLPKIHVPNLFSLQDSTVTLGGKASPVHPTTSQNLAPCQTQQLPLGRVIVQQSGCNTRPQEAGHWTGMKWLEEKERGFYITQL